MDRPESLPFDLIQVHIPLKVNKGEIFRWEVEPGNDVYLVLNYDWDEVGGDLLPTYTEATIKIAWTFRF